MSKQVNLSEYIHPEMDILFLALNAPDVSNGNGHWFTYNLSFWNLLYDAGITTEKIYNKLDGDEKVFGATAINYNKMAIGVTDLDREHVETNSKNVVTTKKQVDRILDILDHTNTQKLCLMHSEVAKEFARQGIIKKGYSYGKMGQYNNTEIFNMPFHNASIPNKVSYYKMLLTDIVSMHQQKAVQQTQKIPAMQNSKPSNPSKVFYLPDGNNSITQGDVNSGTLRITVAAKSYFSRKKGTVNVEINDQNFNASYTPNEGRSDLLRIGKQAMELLNLKAGGELKITKVDSLKFKIEKL